MRLENDIIPNVRNFIEENLSKIKDIHRETFRIDSILDSLSKIDIVNDMITEKYIISVSSGFYIRMIAKYIKDTFNIDACILSIERIESF